MFWTVVWAMIFVMFVLPFLFSIAVALIGAVCTGIVWIYEKIKDF